jgi:hypothetical protein
MVEEKPSANPAPEVPPPPPPIAKPNPQAMNILKNTLSDAKVETREMP